MSEITPANFTRRTPNFVDKFAAQGRLDLIALYHFLRLSDLAREGIEHSGSFRFADHLYQNHASGRGWFGRWLDRRCLNLAASVAMRSRCGRASAEMLRAFRDHIASGNTDPFRILTVPCGIPRDVWDFASLIGAEDIDLLSRIEYTGMDLDPAVVRAAEEFLSGSPIKGRQIIQGDALNGAAYPGERYDFIASTGLGEFLTDHELGKFFGNVFDALAPGGVFFTSGAGHDRGSDFLLRTFELNTHYRTKADLERLLALHPWSNVAFELHPSGLQTFVVARRGGDEKAAQTPGFARSQLEIGFC